MEEWMLRNVQRLRAQYHQSVQDRAHRDKERADKDDAKEEGETPGDGMEMDANGTDVKQSKKNPTELSKRNVRKLRKGLGAIKWVRKLGQLLETQNDWDADLPPWAHGVWTIILGMDKSGKQHLKEEARTEREKQKRKEKRA